MSEFVGRTGALRVYSYPENRLQGSSASFARNFASGPAGATDIPVAGILVPWSSPDAGTPGTDVPITPRSTGLVLITGVITVKSTSGNQETVTLEVLVNGVPLAVPFVENLTIEPGGVIAIPILTETNSHINGGPLPLGTTADVSIFLSASVDDPVVLQVSTESSTLELQEVPVATG